MRDNLIVFAGLMPHAPILGAGRGQGAPCGGQAHGRGHGESGRARGHSASGHRSAHLSPLAAAAGAFGVWWTPRLHGSPGSIRLA